MATDRRGAPHRGAPRRGAVVRLTAVAVLGLALGAGCGDDQSVTAGGDDGPVVDSAAGPPGTPLGNGFEVAEGSTLVGDPIPRGIAYYLDGVPVVDEGWSAMLIADGEPEAVVQAYLDQAEALGLTPVPPSDGEIDGSTDGGGDGDGHCAADLGLFRCEGLARTTQPGPSLQVSVVRGQAGSQVMSHAIVSYSTVDLQWEHGDTSASGEREAPAPEPPDSWPAPPSAGEHFDDLPVLDVLQIEPGSRPAAPPYVTDCATGGAFAVLEVTGDPDAVLAGYAEQITDYVGEEAERSEPRQFGDAVVERVSGAQAGGYHFTVELVRRDGRPAWITLDGCND